MAFGKSDQAKSAEANNQSIASTAVTNSGSAIAQGQGALNTGTQQVQTGANFFNTLAGGNRDASTALLAPDINRIRDANQTALQTTSTLMPRGGGRTAALFARPLSTNDQVNQLYNGVRSSAASNLVGIGQGQQNLGANLFGIGNTALNTGAQTNTGILNYEQQQQQMKNQLFGQLGAGIGGILTAPLGGFGSPSLWGKAFGQR